MVNNNQSFGKAGEDLAEAYLKARDYHIVKRNFSSRLGEIDIIARDEDYVCFIEVKTRTNDEKGHPFESITSSKQRKISRIALGYLQSKGWVDSNIRFDVVAVHLQKDDEPEIELLKNAFDFAG